MGIDGEISIKIFLQRRLVTVGFPLFFFSQNYVDNGIRRVEVEKKKKVPSIENDNFDLDEKNCIDD